MYLGMLTNLPYIAPITFRAYKLGFLKIGGLGVKLDQTVISSKINHYYLFCMRYDWLPDRVKDKLIMEFGYLTMHAILKVLIFQRLCHEQK